MQPQTIKLTGPSSNAPTGVLCAENDGIETLLVNLDANNTVFLSNDSQVSVTDQTQYVPLGPGATVVLNGQRNWFAAVLPGASANLAVIPGGLSYFQLVTLLIKTLIVSASAGNGIFGYNPSPGFGNLIFSDSPTGGFDTYGNAYLPGRVAYTNSGGTFFAATLQGNGISIRTASGAGGPYSSTALSLLTDGTNLTVQNPGSITLEAGNGAIHPAFAFLQSTGFMVPNAPLTTNPETLHSVGGLGAFGAGWADGPNSGSAQGMTYEMGNDGYLHIVGTMHTTSATPAANAFNIATGWRPSATTQRFPCVVNNAGAVSAGFCSFLTTGNVQVNPNPGATGIDVYINASVLLD